MKKTSLSILVLLVAFAHSASADFLINGLGGPAGFGEGVLAANDDGSSDAIDITSVFPDGLNFYGTVYEQIFVNNNGNVTLNSPQSTFTPFAITGNTSNPIFAPFFADVDTRGGPAFPTPGGRSRGTNLVYWDLDTTRGIVTVTWDDVGYFSSHIDRLNAFQLRLISRGEGNFDIEFRWEVIDWTTGDASEGSGGLGGTVARAGWSAGDGENFVELPQSGDEAQMLALEFNPGVLTFQVRDGTVCSISPNPSTIDFGGVIVGGSESQTVRLTNNETQPATVESITIVDGNGEPVTDGIFSIVSDNATGRTIASGVTATFAVSFAPPNSGVFNGNVEIAVDCAGADATLGVELTGRGATPVVFEDAALEARIREILNIPDRVILDSDLETLTSLNIAGLRASNLTGLEAATNLEVIDVRENNFEDIAATFDILNQLPLQLIIRDFPRGGGAPGALTEFEVTGVAGDLIYFDVNLNALEVLDVSTGVIDVTDPDNLIVLRTLEEQGVRLETGLNNLPPAASIRIEGRLADTDGDGFATVTLDGSGSGDIDGTLRDWAWSWDDQRAFGRTTSGTFSTGRTTLTLTVTDDDGATTSTTFRLSIAQLITFEDPAVEAAVREALDMPTQNILALDMLRLTKLDLSGKGVTDLAGLETATNLQILNLQNNRISDIPATFEIIDPLPLIALFRDFPRPPESNPSYFSEIRRYRPNGKTLFMDIDTGALESLDVSGGAINVTNPENLVILDTLQSQGVQINTGPDNLPPAPSIRVIGDLIDSDEDGFVQVKIDGSNSGDIDGDVVDWAWAWPDGATTGETAEVMLPTGQYALSLTVTDDDGAATTGSIEIFTGPDLDEDGDGLHLSEENAAGTTDDNPDFDGDGFYDGPEVDNGLNPTSAEPNATALLNAAIETLQRNADARAQAGLFLEQELLDARSGSILINPEQSVAAIQTQMQRSINLVDWSSNIEDVIEHSVQVPAGVELVRFGVNNGEASDGGGDATTDEDQDGDGLSQSDEIAAGTTDDNPDFDGDGFYDGPEVDNGLDPTSAEPNATALLNAAIETIQLDGETRAQANLFREQDVLDLRFGSVLISADEPGTVTIRMQMQRSTDLIDWSSDSQDIIETTMQIPEGAGFVRFGVE